VPDGSQSPLPKTLLIELLRTRGNFFVLACTMAWSAGHLKSDALLPQ